MTSCGSPVAERPSPAPVAAPLAGYLGAEVVLDLRAPMVVIGRLVEAGAEFFVLADADVHDMHDARSTKERYILEARKHGVRPNRAEVLVRAGEVIAISRLEDVIAY
ncbi:MAG: hypothetical protein KatS3mg102_1902 [Planctomycetota bacterium]|nr:MAG: hypothetical protein KatS3mg102_1902 [Planctomycetota bacterium]